MLFIFNTHSKTRKALSGEIGVKVIELTNDLINSKRICEIFLLVLNGGSGGNVRLRTKKAGVEICSCMLSCET